MEFVSLGKGCGSGSAYTANEGGNEGDTCLSAGDGLAKAEKKGQIAVDLILCLQLSCSLDTLPC